MDNDLAVLLGAAWAFILQALVALAALRILGWL